MTVDTNSVQINYQLTACTGQPILANNVTQAQAFCIATACLQVPVLKKAHTFSLSGNLLERTASRWNLFKSLTSSSGWSLFGRGKSSGGYYQDKLALFAVPQQAQHRFKRHVAIDGTDNSPSTQSQVSHSPTDNLGAQIDDLMHNLSQAIGSGMKEEFKQQVASTAQSEASLPVHNNNSLASAILNNREKHSPAYGFNNLTPMRPVHAQPLPKLALRNTAQLPINYPNFNMMHAQIWSGAGHGASQATGFFNQPYYNRLIVPPNDSRQPPNSANQLLLNWLQSTNDRLAWKRDKLAANLRRYTSVTQNWSGWPKAYFSPLSTWPDQFGESQANTWLAAAAK